MTRVVSILLIILIVTGNFGFTVGTHYCGGKAVKTVLSLNQPDLSCGMKESSYCNLSEIHPFSIERKACCKNHYLKFACELESKQISIFEIKDVESFITPYLPNIENLFSIHHKTLIEYHNYKPPLLKLNIAIWIQCFLL